MFNLILGTALIFTAPLNEVEDAPVIDTGLQVSKTIVAPHRPGDGSKLGELKSYIYSYRHHSTKPSDIGYELTKVINKDIPPKYGMPDNKYYMFGGYMLEVKFNGSIRYNEHVEEISTNFDILEPDYQLLPGKISLYEFIKRQQILDESCDLDRYFYDRYYNNISGLAFKYQRDFDFVNELHAHINACIVGYYDKSDFAYHQHRALRLLTYLKAFPAYYKDTRRSGTTSISQLITIFEKQLNEIHIDTTCTNWDRFGTCGLANYRTY